MMKKRTEEQYALILNTAAVNGAYEHPTPNVAWACADIDSDVFFPADDDSLADAVAICGGCAVRTLCRTMAMARAESGVWGGVLLAEGVPQNGVKRRGRPPKVAVA
ncbi:MAG: WhiB family transcriptional regulator [Aeromicrobium sp.]